MYIYLIYIILLSVTLFPATVHASDFESVKAQYNAEKNNVKQLELLRQAQKSINTYSPNEQAEYWFLLGKTLVDQHKIKDAFDAYTQAVDIYTNNKLPPTRVQVNLLLERARAMSNIDHYNISKCNDRKQALNIAREISEQDLIAKSIAYYANCLQTKEHGVTKSLELFNEAFNIAKSHQLDIPIKQIIYNQAASLYYRALMYDKAYDYNKLAYESIVKTNDTNGIYITILNAIHYSTALTDTKLAWQHLAELNQLSKEHFNLKDIRLKYNYLSAKVAQLEGNWPLSISYLEAGLEHAKDNQNISYRQASLELLSIAYFRVGDKVKSYDMLAQIEALFPNKKPIKKEITLIKGVKNNNSHDIAAAALKLIDIEKQLKNNFVKQSTIQAAQLFDSNLKQLDNIKLEQRLTITITSTILVVTILIFFSYSQTQRRKVAIEEKKLKEELLTKKNQLLADVSHELGTPLTVLKLHVESLKDDLEDDVQVTYDALDNKLDDIQYLIDDIYQLAQCDIGALELNKEAHNINNTFKGWEKELVNFINKNKLAYRIHKDLPENLTLHFDSDRLKQVITNLITNSVKYTDKPGLLKLTATVEKHSLILSMEDSAPGVSDSDLVNIFERLYRVEGSRSRQTGGSGLGLSICQSIIEAHHGKIYAEHSLLGGIKITIELPL